MAVIGLVLLVGGWWVTSVGSAGPLRGPVWGGWQVQTEASLMQQLQQYLAGSASPFQTGRPRAVPAPSPGPSVQGHTCFVGGGLCSIHACVVPVATAAPATPCGSPRGPDQAIRVAPTLVPAPAPTFRPPTP